MTRQTEVTRSLLYSRLPLSAGAWVVLLAMAAGCGLISSREPTTADLVGEYQLYLQWNQPVDDVLCVKAGGTYEHHAQKPGGEHQQSAGRWSLQTTGPSTISFEEWADYYSVTGHSSANGGARTISVSALVEGADPPLIVIDPDANVFYGKELSPSLAIRCPKS